MTGTPIHALLAGAIDYAGLFPPAALPMDEAVRNYAAYLEGDDAWALGRFVVPSARVTQLRDCAAAVGLPGPGKPAWRVSVIGGADWPARWSRDTLPDPAGIAVVDALELRAQTAASILEHSPVPRGIDVFFEIPLDSDLSALVRAIKEAGGKAKVRTGGVTPDAVPAAAELARFVVECARADVAFKATAGLHHVLRARFPLTYEANSPKAEMFGFLNVLLAAAFARAGFAADGVAAVLAESGRGAFRFDEAGVEWCGHRLETDDLARTRATLALSFGSCSFREPIDELQALGLL